MPGSFCTVCRARIPRGSRCSRHRIVSPSGRAWRGKDRVRAAVIARDHGCVICGAVEQLEVHHLKPARLGGETTAENLVVLCTEHHHAVERGEITVSDREDPDGLV